MNNILTRKVLIEKISPFWNYNNPNDVPDKVWEKSYNNLLKLLECNHSTRSGIVLNDYTDDDNLEELNYICREIISPLIGIKEYKISNMREPNDLYKQISIGKNDFYITLSLLIDIKHLYSYITMKSCVCFIWIRSKTRT